VNSKGLFQTRLNILRRLSYINDEDWILWMDSDDTVSPNYIKSAAKVAEKKKDCNYITSNMVEYWEKDGKIIANKLVYREYESKESAIKFNHSISSKFIKKELFNSSLPIYDINLFYGEDLLHTILIFDKIVIGNAEGTYRRLMRRKEDGEITERIDIQQSIETMRRGIADLYLRNPSNGYFKYFRNYIDPPYDKKKLCTRYVACLIVKGAEAAEDKLKKEMKSYEKILNRYNLLDGNKLSFFVFTEEKKLSRFTYPRSINFFCNIQMNIYDFAVMALTEYMGIMNEDIKFTNKFEILSPSEYFKLLKKASTTGDKV